MMPILQIGPLALPLPVLLYIVGVWAGLSLSEKNVHRRNLNQDQVFNLALVAMLTGVAGARLAYVARYSSMFAANPLDIFSRNLGLFDPLSGIVVGVICAAIYAQRKSMPLLPTLDALTPAFAVIAFASNLANIASGEAYGRVTSLPWGIELWGGVRHPSQFYESFAAGLILWRLWPSRAMSTYSTAGSYFLTFIAFSAGAKLLLEAYRAESSTLPGGFRSFQVLAWLLLAACLAGLQRLQKRHNHADILT